MNKSNKLLILAFTAIIIPLSFIVYSKFSLKNKKVIKFDDSTTPSASTSRRVLILYATTTGTTKTFATTLLHHINSLKLSIKLTLSDMKDYNEELLEKEDIVLILSSTWSEGQIPITAKPFFDGLKDLAYDFRISKNYLSKVNFAIFGLGGAIYKENYCKAVSCHFIYLINLLFLIELFVAERII